MSEMIYPDSVEKPTPANLPEFVPFACGQLRASFTVLVQTKIQDEYVSKVEDKTKKLKKSVAVIQQKSSSEELEPKSVVIESDFDEDEIRITAVTDTATQLVGVTINRCVETPRLLLKIIGMCVPFCPYLRTLTLQRCNLTGPIVYEIAKFLPESQITDVNLDDSPIASADRNYYLLVERPSKLRSLSLARCSFANIDCELLFAQLEHPHPASKTLMTLDLSGNFISDTGAHIIGICLRSNRSLQYLNLSGNQITDDGAAHILNSLIEFPLTADEIFRKKMRFMDYLRMKRSLYEKFYKEVSTTIAGKNFDEFSKASKRKAPIQVLARGGSKELIATKAEMLTDELVGRYYDPFGIEETVYRDKYIYSIGNMSLCCLNLAYNNLSFLSIKKLLQLVKYQYNLSKHSGTGLLYVQVEGNNLPLCQETFVLQNWLEQAVLMRTMRMHPPKSPKGRGKK
ncbi:uncharacterized protein LOC128669582 [Plodia interpunctella]|uniref:uncharacterized protein LOC128669582 n=1 Tax=Plodia interpunctella TaxID=58824 RepID=UPI00236755DD|nr:uncharacterized protein LOC128669582 [Plodia interpunctella]